MENTLAKLLVADNELIKQGTAELREALKKPEHVLSLVNILIESKNPEIRQYAAILLKKRYGKSSKSNWFKLSEQTRTDFKSVIKQCVINEPDKHVKQSLAQLIGVIAKHEFPLNSWPEILELIQNLIMSNNTQEILLGIFIISAITDETPKVFAKHSLAIATLLDHIISNNQSMTPEINYYAINVMNNLIEELSSNQDFVNAYNKLLPEVLNIIKNLSVIDPKKANDCLELIDGLCEYNISIIVNHLANIVATCIELANNQSLDEDLRAKAISLIGWLTKAKKKTIMKQKLVEPIICTIFNILSSKPNDENDETYFSNENDEEVPVTCASETLDTLALNLPPDCFIPIMLSHIEPSLKGNDIYQKKAAYLSMAILAEGCSEFVRTKYIKSFLQCICQGIVDPAPVVRNAALFALGQFAEFLQPDVSQYSSQLLPVLFNYLQQICHEINSQKKECASPDRMFYALEVFCENLNEELLPYLQTLMDRLFEILVHPNASAHLKELALGAISAAANACKEHMAPYFQQIIQILNPYLMENKTEDTDAMALKIQAVDTLGVLARTIGKESFDSITDKVLQYALNILQVTSDPDLKKATYGLCASMSTIMKHEITPALPAIMNSLLTTIKNSEGITTHYKNDDNGAYPSIEDSDDNEDEDIENTDNEDDSDDDSAVRYTVENSYTAEKEEAIITLKYIAENTGELFNPYLENCFKEVLEFLTYPQEDIREAAIETLTQFVINFYNIKTNEGTQATKKCLSMIIPRFTTMIRLDEEHNVVITATTSLALLLKTLKQDMFVESGHKEAIMACIKQILEGDTVCQDNDNDTNDGSEETEATESEQDEILIDYAGDLLINFGKTGLQDDFTACFKENLPTLMKLFSSSDNVGRQSFAVGTIAECFAGLKENIRLFPNLYHFFMKLCKHSNEEIRNNAIYGIGEMVLHGKDIMFPCYMEILMNFSEAINNEVHLGARDNIVGAIARLILTNYSILPMEKIYPTFVQQLPLKQDFAEYKAVFDSVLLLYTNGHPILQSQLKPLINVAIVALNEKQLEDVDCKSVIGQFLKSVQTDFPDIWNETISLIPVEQQTILTQYFT